MVMIKQGLVSIITPCYNGEKLIHRLLDSILSQDYPSIEMIIVDDGSKDKTHDVIENYINKFKQKGYSLLYLYQDNAGQAAAINKALPEVNGEFLVWPDADDYYSCCTSISEMVKAFYSLDDSYGIVRCGECWVDEKSLQVIRNYKFNINQEHIFEEYFTGKESIAMAGSCMVRMSMFDKVNPERKIYDKRQPQNFQMILPLAYSYKMFTLDKVLFAILIRSNSHSRHIASYEQHKKDFEGYKDILYHTFDKLEDMKDADRENAKKLSSIYCLTGKMYYALKFGKPQEAHQYAKSLRTLGVRQTEADMIRLWLVYCPPLLKVFDYIVDRLRNRFKK